MARSALARLGTALRTQGQVGDASSAQPQFESLTAKKVVVAYPRVPQPALRGIDLQLTAGETLGIIGPNGAGKTTLLKALLGLVPLNAGSVHIDDLDIRKITQAIRIDKIGYLPQEIDLFAATIAENIAKLDIANLEEIHAATRLAGVHDAIMQMPRGYETHVDKQNAQVSAGIRQRIGLARAIFGAPSLIVLDEPNSYQDAEGDRALAEILRTAKERRAITVVASHRPLMMPEVDKLCFLVNGEIKLFGPREEVQRKLFAQVSGPGKAPGGIAPPPRGPEQGTPPNGH